MCTLGSKPRVLIGNGNEAGFGFAQKFGRRTVDAGHGRIADGRVKAAILERLKSAPVGLTHLLMGGDELADQLRGFRIGDA